MVFGGENAESYYDEGLTASMKGDLTQAIAHFEHALKLDPGMHVAMHQLGRCYQRLGEMQRAARILHQVISAKPDLVPARVDYGFVALELGEVARARQVFSEVASARPGNTRAQLGLAACAFHEGQWQAAVELAQASINLGGTSFSAFYLLGRAAGLAGDIGLSAEALARAEKVIEKSIETSPDAPEGYFLRGEVLFAQENYGKALENYTDAMRRGEMGRNYTAFGEQFTLVDMLSKRGLCQVKLGDAEGARKTGEAILKLDPEHKLAKTFIAPAG